MVNNMEHFKKLNLLDVNAHVEKKNGLSYLSWAWAWATVKKEYPEATYKVIKDDSGKAYFGDDKTGYMVYTEVTIEGMTHEMWLPVMDFKNKSILQPTTFDINKAIMRCLTKNLAMFGVGLYIYAGEDLPEDDKQPIATEAQKSKIKKLYVDKKMHKDDFAKLLEKYGTSFDIMSKETAVMIIEELEK